MADHKVGSQLPTQSIVLPFESSKGAEAIEIYEQSGRKAFDWQKLLVSDLMAVGPDGLWTHQKFGYEVPRQNGKGEVLVMREWWGLVNGENICHTAHKTSTSHSAFVRLKKALDDAGYTELGRKKKDAVIPNRSYKSTKQYGLEQIFLTEGGTIVFRTRTEAGGIGESFDLLVIDEAQEYTETQQSALMYTISASINPQTIMCGTPPTVSSKGTVFVNLRNKTLAGKSPDTGWAEWSVYQKPKDVMETDLWYQTNPSLGFRLRERTIRNEDVSNELDFMIQRLGYWHSYALQSEITEADWKHLAVQSVPDLKGKLFAGIKFGSDGLNTSMSIAVRCTDGRIFVETIDCQPQAKGFDWLIRFLKKASITKVSIDGKGKTDLFLQVCEEAGIKAKLLNANTTSESITAYSSFRQAIDTEAICHKNQPSVIQAVSNCEKRLIGTNGAFGFRSIKEGIDISIVESLALAYWMCQTTKERRKQKIMY